MTLFTRLLCAFYGTVFLGLSCAAVDQAVQGTPWAAPVLAICAVAPLLGWLREVEHADDWLVAERDAKRAARIRARQDTWENLETSCCLRSWESRGAEHDTHHCARKDRAA